MIQESIKVQCPNPECKCILNIKNPGGLIGKILRCPKCQVERPFDQYPRVVTKPKAEPNEDDTQYGPKPSSTKQNSASGETHYSSQPEDKTTIPDNSNSAIGKLKCQGKIYDLKLGVNIVGRKAITSKANVQIDVQTLPDETGRTMSRHHLQIIVQKDQNKLMHLVKLVDNVTNATYLNQKLLQNKDILILSNGDILKMGKVMVEFVQGDDDGEKTIL